MATLRAWEGENGRSGGPYFEEMLARRDRVRAQVGEQVGAPADRIALTASTTQGVQIVVVGPEPRRRRRGRDDRRRAFRAHRTAAGLASRASDCQGARTAVCRVLRRRARPGHIADAARSRCRPSRGSTARSSRGASYVRRPACRCSWTVPSRSARSRSTRREADYYTISAQKWLCGPDGCGGLYIRDPDSLRHRLVVVSQSPRATTSLPEPGNRSPAPPASIRVSPRLHRSPGSKPR